MTERIHRRHGELNADDLLVFLEVARTGRYSSAADRMGVNHTTISRRIARLEKALGGRVLTRGPHGAWEVTHIGEGALDAAKQIDRAVHGIGAGANERDVRGVVRVSAPDGFAAYLLTPAAARVRERHPHVSIEIVTTTRRALQQRSDIDLEIVVGKPQVNRAETLQLCEYRFGLFAAQSYLDRASTPHDFASLGDHPLIYFADTMLQVDALDMLPSFYRSRTETISASNTFVHVEATRAGAGIGLLATYMARRHPELVRIMQGDVDISLSYWIVSRRDVAQRTEVAAVVRELTQTLHEMRDILT